MGRRRRRFRDLTLLPRKWHFGLLVLLCSSSPPWLELILAFSVFQPKRHSFTILASDNGNLPSQLPGFAPSLRPGCISTITRYGKSGGKRMTFSRQPIALTSRPIKPNALATRSFFVEKPGRSLVAQWQPDCSILIEPCACVRPSRGSRMGRIPNSGQINRISSAGHFAVANC